MIHCAVGTPVIPTMFVPPPSCAVATRHIRSKTTLLSSSPVNRLRARNFMFESLALKAGISAFTGLGLTSLFAMYRYRISDSDQYLVRTGLGIPDMSISKQGFQWPFQKYRFIDMHPANYKFNLQSMSLEKMEFILPGVFTIGPKNDKKALERYARYLVNSDKGSEEASLDNIIKGILEGEVRILSASLTIEEIFNDRRAFKEKIVKNVQEELDQFGLYIMNANIKELQDSPGSEYFSYLRQKKRSEAENRAKIDVAEANKVGNIGEKEREAVTRQEMALLESTTVTAENERNQTIEKSNAELQVVKNEAWKRKELSRVESVNAAEIRDLEMKRLVEQARIVTQIEKTRAVELVKATVEAEALVKEAEGKAAAQRAQAEAELYSKQKEAEGIFAVYQAQSQGLAQLMATLGHDKAALMQYLMIQDNTYEKLAQSNAQAIQGLNPKITVWNTGSSDSDKDSYAKPIADIFRSLPPLVSTIHDQTGIRPSKHLLEMDVDQSETAQEKTNA